MRRIKITLYFLLLLCLLFGCTPSGNITTTTTTTAVTTTAANVTTTEKVDEYAAGIVEPRILSVGTGTAGGTQFVFISAIGNIINNNVKNLSWSMEASTGGVNNLALMQTGDFDLGFAEQSTAFDWYNGYGLSAGQTKFDDLRAVFPCYTQDFLFSTTDPNIKTFEDLNGKTIALGSIGGSLSQSFQKLQSIFSFKNVTVGYTTWSEAFNLLGEGRYDAIMGIFGQPSSLVSEYNTNSQYPALLHQELSDEVIQKIIDTYPYYTRTTLPKDMYTSFTEDYNTYGCWAFVYANKSLENVIVYETVKALFENRDDLIATIKSAQKTVPEAILESKIPIHVGALKYYLEIGLDIPEELYPPEYK